MRQAITTKFLPPTNYRGARIAAKAAAKTLVMVWREGWNVEENYIHAARRLARTMEWTGAWAGGELPSGDGYCFVLDTGRGFVVEPFYLEEKTAS